MTPRRKSAIGAALALCLGASLLLTACGGDDGADSPDFVEEADAICEAQDNQIAEEEENRFGEDRLGPGTQAEEAAFASATVIPGIQAQVDELSKLEVPAEDRDDFDQFVAALQKGLQEAEADPLELTIYGDSPRKDPVFAEAIQLAEQIGFDDCTEGEPDIPG